MRRVALGILALAAAHTLAAPAAAQDTRDEVRRTPQRDSLVALGVELERVTYTQRTLMRDFQLAQIALSRASDADRPTWRARVAELGANMERIMRDAEVLRAHLQALCNEGPQPEGWLGISFTYTGEMDAAASRSATAFTFKKYPTIETVDPGSPAQKAGLLAGDEIVTLGSFDMVSGALEVTSLLKPGVQLPVRYRRDGLLRRLTVLIEPRPHGFNSGCPWIEVSVTPPAFVLQPKLRIIPTPNGFSYILVDSAKARARRAPMIASTPMEPGARPRETMTPVLPPTPYAPLRLQGALSGPNAIVGGAVLVPMSDELRQGLGLDEGILVLDVLRGSPALEAGLRAGDIIVRVNGRKLSSILLLLTAMDDARDSDVELQVSRRNAKRIVRLRP